MIITAARFCQIGEALFGRAWKSVFAEMLCVNQRMVYRIVNGDANVSPEMRAKMAAVCRTRGEALLRIADQLDPPQPMHWGGRKT